ncbi:alpha/beta hydrolase [Lacticaseibacillus hegangensis]|uniref:Alpha/beta hydrolase n=1 Tax=Lacticaseibacillus hegangensis TaxID=2486010 RepID=A0ABW4CVY4_9LACO|nr:alpha/beta hydrolase-fold protein [Lacticaseibacillus hegangensis]
MANLALTFSSTILKGQNTVHLILPDKPLGQKIPVIWLLHGLGDDGSCWIRKTRLEQLTTDVNVAVVMPDMGRSFYRNLPGGLHYYIYLSEELPEYLQSLFPLSRQASENFLVGNSMGGYGSFYWAAHQPEKFSYVATLSPVTDLSTVPSFMPDYESSLGSKPAALPTLLDEFETNASKLQHLNWLTLAGKDDQLTHASVAFAKSARDSLGIDINEHVLPGKHDWTFWDQNLSTILSWLPLKKIDRVGGNNYERD